MVTIIYYLEYFLKKKNKEVLSKYADGFELYDWFNSVAPKESLTLVGHRSYFFAEKDVIYFGIAAHLAHQKQPNLKTDQYYLNKLEKKNPNYILFYGFEENYDFYRYNFEKCTTGLVAKKNKVGHYATRNIFNQNKKFYNAYLYKLDSSNLIKCVKIN